MCCVFVAKPIESHQKRYDSSPEVEVEEIRMKDKKKSRLDRDEGRGWKNCN